MASRTDPPPPLPAAPNNKVPFVQATDEGKTLQPNQLFLLQFSPLPTTVSATD